MTLKTESRNIITSELKRRVEKIVDALNLKTFGITVYDMGVTDELISKVIDQAYLEVFTVEEVEEMVAFNQKFADRTFVLEAKVEKMVGEAMEANKDVVMEKVMKSQDSHE